MHSISAVVEESTAATEEMSAQASQVTNSIQSIAAVSDRRVGCWVWWVPARAADHHRLD
jgi:methyl-accepting chemotaxis protein